MLWLYEGFLSQALMTSLNAAKKSWRLVQKKIQSIDHPILEQTTLKVPIWAFDYWVAIERISKEKALWLVVEKKLKREGAHSILDLL